MVQYLPTSSHLKQKGICIIYYDSYFECRTLAKLVLNILRKYSRSKDYTQLKEILVLQIVLSRQNLGIILETKYFPKFNTVMSKLFTKFEY